MWYNNISNVNQGLNCMGKAEVCTKKLPPGGSSQKIGSSEPIF